jgi:hypothetical protein
MRNTSSKPRSITRKAVTDLKNRRSTAVFQNRLAIFLGEADASLSTIKGSTWLRFGRTDVCFRVSKRKIYEGVRVRVLDIASITTPTSDQRKGRFQELLRAIRQVTYMPLYIENAFPEFALALQGEKYGFSIVSTDGHSFCLFRNELQEDTNMKRLPVLNNNMAQYFSTD